MTIQQFQQKAVQIVTSSISQSTQQPVDTSVAQITILEYLPTTQKELVSFSQQIHQGGFRWIFFLFLGKILENIGLRIYGIFCETRCTLVQYAKTRKCVRPTSVTRTTPQLSEKETIVTLRSSRRCRGHYTTSILRKMKTGKREFARKCFTRMCHMSVYIFMKHFFVLLSCYG